MSGVRSYAKMPRNGLCAFASSATVLARRLLLAREARLDFFERDVAGDFRDANDLALRPHGKIERNRDQAAVLRC